MMIIFCVIVLILLVFAALFDVPMTFKRLAWLHRNRHWKNTRQKMKAMARECGVSEHSANIMIGRNIQRKNIQRRNA
jgi:hypothetical protein